MPRPSRALEYLAKLRGAWPRLGRVPSYADLAKLWNLRSKASVARAVEGLRDAGYLAKRGGILLPGPGFFAVPVVEGVPAGFPSPGGEEAPYDLDVGSWLVGKPTGTALVKVKGLSMRDAGILPGDVLAVEKGREPRQGDVVVAEVDGAWTVKRYARDRRGAYLQAANPDFKDIRTAGEIRVFGVAVSVMRKLK